MEASSPEWYEIVAGIIAIPVALIGAVYTISLIRKTRLESKKLEIELLKVETESKELRDALSVGQKKELVPQLNASTFQFIVLKFIIFYILLRAWALIEDAFRFLAGGAFLGLTKSGFVSPDSEFIVAIFYVISNVPQLFYWIIFIGLGWSIFRDANDLLGFKLKDFFSWTKKP